MPRKETERCSTRLPLFIDPVIQTKNNGLLFSANEKILEENISNRSRRRRGFSPSLFSLDKLCSLSFRYLYHPDRHIFTGRTGRRDDCTVVCINEIINREQTIGLQSALWKNNPHSDEKKSAFFSK